MALWHDKRGTLSPLRAAALLALLTPGIALVYYSIIGDWGPRPVNEAIHFIGQWTVRILLATFLVSPLRRLARWPRLIDVRRMMGVTAFCYIALHLMLFIVDQKFDLATVASEIVLRYYLTIGFTAWLGLAALAATSNDYMVRKMGGERWRKLHQLIYPIAALACIHYFMQAKLEVFQPTVVAGIFGWAMLYRIAHWTTSREFRNLNGELPLWFLAALSVFSAALTFIFEALGFWLFRDVPPLMVLEVDFTFIAGIRPGWYVLMAGAALTLIAAVRNRPVQRRIQLASSAGRTPS